jgi:SAM-dependent methyltransferase
MALLARMTDPRLNIGCGRQVHPEWVNADTDAYDTWPADYRILFEGDTDAPQAGDVIQLAGPGFPWPDSTFAGIACHHVLQMIPYPQLVPWLAELRRVTEPGGWLRVSVPDLMRAISAHRRNDSAWFPIADDLEPTVGGKFCLYLSQAGGTRSVFTVPWLRDLLERAGWQAPQVAYPGTQSDGTPEWLHQLDSRPHESVFMEAFA